MSKQQQLMSMYKDIRLFAEVCFPMTLKKAVPDFHNDLYRVAADTSIKKILCVAPRHHAKTSVMAEIVPLHIILFNALVSKEREVIVLVSKTSRHTNKLLRTIKEHLDSNPKLRHFFGDFGHSTAQKWGEDEIILKNGNAIFSLGMGQQFHGIKSGQQRPTFVVLDDPEDDENTRTREAAEKNMDWLLKALIPAMDSDRGRIIVIGTMISEGCMVDALSKALGWHKLWYKAIPDMSKKESLWPELYSYKRLMRELEEARSLGKEHIWYMNYQNEFQTGSNQPFKTELIKDWEGTYYPGKDRQGIIHLKQVYNSKGVPMLDKEYSVPVYLFWGYDPATSKSRRADKTAIEFWAMDSRQNLYLIWKFNERADPIDAAEVFYKAYFEYSVRDGNIETVQAQETIRSMLEHRMKQDHRYILGITTKNQPRQKKSQRILSDVWRYKGGFIHIRHGGEDTDFRLQASGYVPDKESQHEDLLDAQYYAFKAAYPHPEPWAEWDGEPPVISDDDYTVMLGDDDDSPGWMGGF